MGIIDIKPKLADIKAKIGKVIFGVNKEEKKITIKLEDKSTHVHYHNEVGLSDEDILLLPADQIGKLLKKRTLINLEVALRDKPEEMQKYLAMYNSPALTVGATTLTASVLVISPMPSGDFIEQLPGAIEASVPHDFVSVKDIAFVKIEGGKEGRKKEKEK